MELLRTVFGEKRSTVIAAAFIPNPKEAPESTPSAEPETGHPETSPDRKRPPQQGLFNL